MSSQVVRSDWFKPAVLAALLGLPLPLYAWLSWDHITEKAVAQPCEMRIAGYVVRPSAEGIDGQLANLARAYLSGTIVLAAGAQEVRATRAAFGAAVDAHHLRALLQALADPTSPLRLVHDQHRAGQTLHVPMPIRLDVRTARQQVLRLKDVLDTKAEVREKPDSAHPDLRGKPGRSLHLMETLLRLRHALRSGQATIEPVVLDVPFAGESSA